MNTMQALTAVVTLALVGYLLFALLYPEDL